jgi:hypothetical protein
MKMEAGEVKIGEGNSIRTVARGIFTFSSIFLINTMIKGE